MSEKTGNPQNIPYCEIESIVGLIIRPIEFSREEFLTEYCILALVACLSNLDDRPLGSFPTNHPSFNKWSEIGLNIEGIGPEEATAGTVFGAVKVLEEKADIPQKQVNITQDGAFSV